MSSACTFTLSEPDASVVTMPDTGLYANMPPYLRRYLATWSPSIAAGESWPDHMPSSQDDYIRHLLDDRQARGLKYLTMTLRDIRYASLAEQEVIDLLAEVPGDGSTAVIVTELVRRLPEMAEESKSHLAAVLISIAGGTQEAGEKRIAADRALMRLLYRMDCDATFLPAAVCAKSDRAIRREASYRFYLKYGLDETAREILTARIWEDSERYRRVITTDVPTVRELGLDNVLPLAPSSYWRMRAIACALRDANDAEVLAICEDYPLELIWAINVGCVKHLLPHVLELLGRYANDAYLLNRILQCLAILGDPAGLALGIMRATDALEGAEVQV
jgi:hypothetical protein